MCIEPAIRNAHRMLSKTIFISSGNVIGNSKFLPALMYNVPGLFLDYVQVVPSDWKEDKTE